MNGKPASPEDQCTATARQTGERCTKPRVLGTTVCRFHGGNAKHVREAAAQRLLEALPVAIDRLTGLLDPVTEEPCPFCKRGMPRDENVILKATGMILDRTGLAVTQRVEVTSKDETVWLQYLTDDELEQVSKLMEAASIRMHAELGTIPQEEEESVH